MANKTNVRIPVTEYLPENAGEFLLFWAKKIDEVPAEYRDTATISVEAVTSYGDLEVEVEISYERPSTLAEIEQRKADANRQAGFKARRELETLARLKAKYPEE